MSILHDSLVDVPVPVTVVSAGGMMVAGTDHMDGVDKSITLEKAISTEPVEYQHVSLPTVGTIRVRYSRIEPLKPRRFEVEDDLP